jgi:RNA polymerase sigma factor (sigma-70 family)
MNDEQLLRERFGVFIVQNLVGLMGWAKYMCDLYPPPPAHSAEDLLHDVIVEASGKLDPVKGETGWKPWLIDLIRWRAIQLCKRGRRSPVILAGDVATAANSDIIANTACEEPSPAEFDDLRDMVRRVRLALAVMQNEQQCRVVELVLDNFAAGGKPNLKKVAEDMNISCCNAKQLFQRAKEALKHSLRQLAKEMNIPTERPNHES